MRLFDNLRTQSGYLVNENTVDGRNFSPAKIRDRSNEVVISQESMNLRAEEIRRRDQARTLQQVKNELNMESPIFAGFHRVRDPMPVQKDRVTRTEAFEYLNSAKSVFEHALLNSLFVGKLNTIIMESAPVEDYIKSNSKIEAKVYNIALELFNGIDESKNYGQLVQNESVPFFVQDLYETCRVYATLESNARFVPESMVEGTEFKIDALKGKIEHEMANVRILDDFYKDKFEKDANSVILQNEDVIDVIKSKVSGELKSLKKSQDDMKAIKEDAKKTREDNDMALDEKGNSSGSTEPEDDTETGMDDNATDSGTGDNAGGDFGTGDAGNADAGGTDNAGTDTGENTTDNADNGDNQNAEGNGNPGEGEENTNSDNPTTNETEEAGANNGIDPDDIDGDVQMEIDAAASFAENNQHTFNTGDEKFSDLYKKYAQQFTKAAETQNIKQLKHIQAAAAKAADRIQQININAGRKYNETAVKLQKLSDNIQFEINKTIENIKKVKTESRSLFESLVVKIGKRQLATFESGDVSELNSNVIINEAVLDYTVFETFNTLKILDLTNESERVQFLDSLGMPLNQVEKPVLGGENV